MKANESAQTSRLEIAEMLLNRRGRKGREGREGKAEYASLSFFPLRSLRPLRFTCPFELPPQYPGLMWHTSLSVIPHSYRSGDRWLPHSVFFNLRGRHRRSFVHFFGQAHQATHVHQHHGNGIS